MRRQQFVIRRARPAPFGINARGEMVGYYMDAGGVWRGFVTTEASHEFEENPELLLRQPFHPLFELRITTF